MSTSALKSDAIVMLLPDLLHLSKDARAVQVKRIGQCYGLENLPIALFKYQLQSLAPVIKDAAANAFKWEQNDVEDVFTWADLDEEQRQYWRGEAGTLLNGSDSALQLEALEAFLAVAARGLVLDLESQELDTATEMILISLSADFNGVSRGFSKLSQEAANMNASEVGETNEFSSDDSTHLAPGAALMIADRIRHDLLEHHAVALSQAREDATGSTVDHQQQVRPAWDYLSAEGRIYWSYQAIQVLYRLIDGDEEAIAHLDTTQAGHRSLRYAEYALQALVAMSSADGEEVE
ncbi:hypothetical protein LTR37_015640 [Vermiconidia calcicola]|uniref:Uncharacterized protein n=1 Tax=Vermiconidia calcicola TaxID=1690605 RepID=A0ACC3MQV9_9PEZI|nr:hypothetical protein LTR37_015640 [Vermiconidia calcicola]